MPALTQEEVKSWGRARIEKEMRERLDDVQAIRLRAGGSLANVTGDDNIERVKQHNADLNLLGERKDDLLALEAADKDAADFQHDLDSPEGKMRHSRGNGTPSPVKGKVDSRDAGTIYASSKAFQQYQEDGQKGIECEIPISSILPEYKALDLRGFQHPRQKVLGSDDSLAGVDTEFPPESRRVGVVVEELFQQPNIADLFPQTTIDQNSVPFMRETVVDQGASETPEAGEKPEASLEFAEDKADVKKVAVLLPVTEEILEDEQLVRGHINGRLPMFIRLREDFQLLHGAGGTAELPGILTLSGIDATTSYSIGGDDAVDKLESVFSASIRVQEAFLVPDAVVMGLGLWEQVRLAKGNNGQYLIAPATDQAAPRIWGLRVVTNQNMPAESAGNTPILVGAFAQAGQIWRRVAMSLDVTDSHGDNFYKDIIVIRARTRLAVTHYRPAGYAVVTSAA